MLVPLTDASRRPTRVPVVTACIIALNALMFVLELAGGESFVKTWSVVPADIVAGRHWITILTAMFMHGSWSHIIGNMIFLWAFGPEVEDLMGRGRYLAFYLLGGWLRRSHRSPPPPIPPCRISARVARSRRSWALSWSLFRRTGSARCS
jgi:membrane associated rhomboid family serine protease